MIVNKRNKMELTPEQIQENWDKLLGIIDKYISSPRKEQLKALYEKYEDRLATMPASGREAFHSCFVGGYVDHILNVIECGLKTAKMWEFFGAKKDWTDEELVFSLMNHDFGKVGDDDGEYYIPNESEWHRKNLGIMYSSEGRERARARSSRSTAGTSPPPLPPSRPRQAHQSPTPSAQTASPGVRPCQGA